MGASFTPRQYADMALFVGSDIDLGAADAVELHALAVEAIAAGWGFVITGGGE